MADATAMRRAAMNLLARRDHSRYELLQKLVTRFPDKSALNEVISQLHEDGLQDDARFAQSYLRYRAARGLGPERISQELQQKGIDSATIAEAFALHETDWQLALLELYQKKYGEQKPFDINEKARCTRFLVSRGFSFAAINQLWRELA